MNKKLAALDIGTNSFHLIVVAVLPSGKFKIIAREREIIRLSEGNIKDNKSITSNSIERAISTINRFNKIAEYHGAKLRAIATSAVRESLNRNEFLESIYGRTGVQIEVISGLEEARLIYIGILKAVSVFDMQSLSIDIGGGSTEFIIGHRGEIQYSQSLKLGAVRLSQMFSPDYILTDSKIAEAKKIVEEIISPIVQEMKNRNFEIVIGTSGTTLNIAMMIKAMRGEEISDYTSLNNFEFTFEELLKIGLNVLNKKTPDERKNIVGLETKRIDIIPAGVIILVTILKFLKIEKMKVSSYALKEGIIINTLAKLSS